MLVAIAEYVNLVVSVSTVCYCVGIFLGDYYEYH